jgi:hypothetical protein
MGKLPVNDSVEGLIQFGGDLLAPKIFFITVFYSNTDASYAEICFLYDAQSYCIPGPVQVTVFGGEPNSNPGQLRPLSGVAKLP